MTTMTTIGFIGVGNMGEALVRGMVSGGAVAESDVFLHDAVTEKADTISKAIGGRSASSAKEVVSSSDVVFICVKPKDMADVLSEVEGESDGKLFVSIAAGASIATIENALASDARVIRVMPNTPAVVGEMAAGLARGAKATDEDVSLVTSLLSSLGFVVEVGESLLDAVTGLSGSGPAYFFYVIKTLAAGGVEQGLPEDVALTLAAQTAKGAAEMVLSGKGTPDELIDAVSSPGGTTVAGLAVLEEKNVGESLRETVAAASRRAKVLGR